MSHTLELYFNKNLHLPHGKKINTMNIKPVSFKTLLIPCRAFGVSDFISDRNSDKNFNISDSVS